MGELTHNKWNILYVTMHNLTVKDIKSCQNDE